MLDPLAQETVWFDKWRADDAERMYQEKLSKACSGNEIMPRKEKRNKQRAGSSSLVGQIEKARQHIQQSLQNPVGGGSASADVVNRLEVLEKENKELRQAISDMRAMVNRVESLDKRVTSLEKGSPASAAAPAQSKTEESEDDDDFDPFASDDEEEDAEAERIKQERLAAYQAKKSKKPVLIAKSSVLLDVKVWDDETDLNEMEKLVRSIEMDGLIWGASKHVPVGYGIKKLQICCVIEDDKVSTEVLEEKITDFEDFVQSVDIAAFNKI